jgi:hypothetical protein
LSAPTISFISCSVRPSRSGKSFGVIAGAGTSVIGRSPSGFIRCG